ncbi:hypothetical protein KSP39_PZI003409 [Platanthera zijinensis]|uniref:Sulfotransferase n=1 Tax=Platanthera zijinensis TaxID=2320716 RepID=A0AAP0BTR7_9ASPA
MDMLFVNPPRKSPLLLKMVALVACMICSISVFFVFLNQMKTPKEIHMVRLNLTVQDPTHVMRINLTEVNLTNTVRVYLTEKTATFDVRANLSEITLLHEMRANFSEKALLPIMRVNLTEKASHHPNVSQSKFLLPDYNKNKSSSSKEQPCMPVTLYAIVSVQRSGSKWFEALLNNHDNIRSHGEIFYNVDRKCNMTVIKAVLDRVYSLKWNVSTFRRKKKNCMAAVGFKWMLNQGILDNHEGIVDYLNHRGISVILLFRRNHLRRLVSHKANNYDGLSKTHKAHAQSKNEADILASYRPKLNIRTLIPTLEHMESLVTNTMNYFKSTRHTVVYYEDLVQNQTQKMMEVLEFLRAPQRRLISGHVKIHTRPLAQQISNWNAVVKAVKRSKYRRFIADNDYEM